MPIWQQTASVSWLLLSASLCEGQSARMGSGQLAVGAHDARDVTATCKAVSHALCVLCDLHASLRLAWAVTVGANSLDLWPHVRVVTVTLSTALQNCMN